jgi:hypothetical protein
MTVPGIGPIISSAMVAPIGTGDAFSKGRDQRRPKPLAPHGRTIHWGQSLPCRNVRFWRKAAIR